MKKIGSTVRAYLSDVNTFIFNSWIDALLGAVPLILIPLLSLLSLLWIKAADFWNYCFPIISISLAGAYDTYGRFKPNSVRNLKLAIRLTIDFVAMFFACALQTASPLWRAIPSFLLFTCGLALGYEVIRRVMDAIESSPWYLEGDEKNVPKKQNTRFASGSHR